MEMGQLRKWSLKHLAHRAGGEPGLGIAAIALTSITAFSFLHPHPVVLPMLSAILVVVALGMAAFIAWRHRDEPASLPDRMLLAGLIIFFGFIAGILADADAMVQSLQAAR